MPVRNLWSKASAVLLTLTLGACSALQTPPEASRFLPGPIPTRELTKEIRLQTGWIWGPKKERVVVPAKHLKAILASRMRWIIYSRALIKAGAWKKKPVFKNPLGMGLAPGGKARMIVPKPAPSDWRKSY